MSNATYQKINWGWLNDYNGYKFAPITFFEQLYTENGTAFKTDYDNFTNKVKDFIDGVKNGDVVVKKAQSLAYVNEDGSSTLYNTSSSKPVYFKNGVPEECTEINGLTTISGDVIKFNNPQLITIGNTTRINNGTDENLIWHHEDIGFAGKDKSGLLSADKEQTITGNKNFTGNISGAGYYFINDNIKSPALYKNGNHLWIGATGQNGEHHIGPTYISAGYTNSDKNTGNNDVFICIPKEGGENKNSIYEIFHTGKAITTSKEITVNNNDVVIRHDFERSSNLEDSIKQELPERFFGFYDRNGTLVRKGRLSAIRSVQKDNSTDTQPGSDGKTPFNYRNYICMTAYSPKAYSDDASGDDLKLNSYGEFYVYVDGDNYAEAGVSSNKTVVSKGGTPGNNIVFMGAAWNDYAEFRDQIIAVEPGYCVASTDDGKVYKTTEKFQACDGIVSDTYGFAIGRSETYQTPLAVSGRVLAYCEGDKYDYHAGDTVCAGPEGKVCKMTREEIKEWPDRIIGIVSEIPEYDEWTGRKVNNRIWIKVK